MTLVISVEFLHGTFRGDPDGTANTGRLDRGEWPPSPARLFAALIAAGGIGDSCRFSDGSELELLEQLPPPTIVADPEPAHQRLLPRFVVRHGGPPARGSHHEYLGRAGTVNRSGVRVAPRRPQVDFVWDDAAPSAAVFTALRARAARIGYLGASDSPVRIRIAVSADPVLRAKPAFVPDQTGDVFVNVIQSGDLAHWGRFHDQWTRHGASVSRSQFPALRHPARYRSPLAPESEDRGSVVAWLRIDPAVSGRRIAILTALFKRAVLRRYQDQFGEPPAVLHGHGFKETWLRNCKVLCPTRCWI